MNFYIRELSDGTASLITDSGSVIWTFPSLGEARQACTEAHKVYLECYPDDEGTA
jgi:hypothetical protein